MSTAVLVLLILNSNNKNVRWLIRCFMTV